MKKLLKQKSNFHKSAMAGAITNVAPDINLMSCQELKAFAKIEII